MSSFFFSPRIFLSVIPAIIFQCMRLRTTQHVDQRPLEPTDKYFLGRISIGKKSGQNCLQNKLRGRVMSRLVCLLESDFNQQWPDGKSSRHTSKSSNSQMVFIHGALNIMKVTKLIRCSFCLYRPIICIYLLASLVVRFTTLVRLLIDQLSRLTGVRSW